MIYNANAARLVIILLLYTTYSYGGGRLLLV